MIYIECYVKLMDAIHLKIFHIYFSNTIGTISLNFQHSNTYSVLFSLCFGAMSDEIDIT